jgi:hypothetical protein
LTATIAHRYAADIALMAALCLNAYVFSVGRLAAAGEVHT